MQTRFLGRKINKTRIVPLSAKLIIIFTIFILVSNFASNYINLIYNRSELVKHIREQLIRDLKEIYTLCNTQYEIYQYSDDYQESVQNIERNASGQFKNEKSIFLGVKEFGEIQFQASKIKKHPHFEDNKTLALMRDNRRNGIYEGAFPFRFNGDLYFGLYKYHPKWDLYLLRGEEYNEFYAESVKIFWNISIIIIIITLLTAFVGIILLNHITRFIKVITNRIMQMTEDQELGIIDLKGATNDDITFLGMAFNSLSSSINSLLHIFRKFVNRDIAEKAYLEREVHLEGEQLELTILFSDIKRFTFITETLGADIIKLLNVHYDYTIKEILKKDGIIGSIMGDALLAVYGLFNGSGVNKSYQAILSAYRIQEIASLLRRRMHEKKEKIIAEKGSLTEAEERVYQAVLIEVGVGIDRGNVYYGNIGSEERMTNTVIGDSVNSASRLEGLTRVYNAPIIVSSAVKEDIEQNVPGHDLIFVEIDTVLVKGKSIGSKIYWPIQKDLFYGDLELQNAIHSFSEGLHLYYSGEWEKAHQLFKDSNLALAKAFIKRTSIQCPKNWEGIWRMTSK